MLGLPFPAEPRVKVFGQELHFLLQYLLHRPVWNAFGVHQDRLPHILGVVVCLVAALSRQRRILVRVGNRVLRAHVALRLARVCVIAHAARLRLSARESVTMESIACANNHIVMPARTSTQTSPCPRRRQTKLGRHRSSHKPVQLLLGTHRFTVGINKITWKTNQITPPSFAGLGHLTGSLVSKMSI